MEQYKKTRFTYGVDTDNEQNRRYYTSHYQNRVDSAQPICKIIQNFRVKPISRINVILCHPCTYTKYTLPIAKMFFYSSSTIQFQDWHLCTLVPVAMVEFLDVIARARYAQYLIPEEPNLRKIWMIILFLHSSFQLKYGIYLSSTYIYQVLKCLNRTETIAINKLSK